ncbi:MAG: hypothetical protein GY941_25330 [Planctomycetes bacterium]|nr:hypothetical protein [Planctomycetota bacterium]
MAKQIINQTYGTAIVDAQGKPTVAFFTLLEQLTNLEIMDGAGSPEGEVKARFKSLYIDTDINYVYIKTTNDSLNTGWVLVT